MKLSFFGITATVDASAASEAMERRYIERAAMAAIKSEARQIEVNKRQEAIKRETETRKQAILAEIARQRAEKLAAEPKDETPEEKRARLVAELKALEV